MGTLTQGVADDSRLRLLLFVRFALGYSPMTFQAIHSNPSQKVPHP